MQKSPLTLIVLLLLTSAFLVSCKKESIVDPKLAFTNQMKLVTDSIIANTHVPGIVALVVDHKRGIDWLYTAGLSDLANATPMNGNYTFRIGSNTKTMTITVLLQLVDEGKLKLNDKLSDFYPGIPNSDSITIAMLCNMTSGIYSFSESDIFRSTMINYPAKVWLPQELVDLALTYPPYFSPGSSFHYSNTNTIILGQIIESITGNTLESEISHRIVQPLNLSQTGLITSGQDFPGPHAKGYYMGTYTENEEVTNQFDISWGWAAGSAYSTPRELQKYVEALIGGGLLSDSLQNRRISDMKTLAPNIGYGLGLVRRGSFYGHNGALPGFTSSMYHSIDKDCTIIIYFNSQIELVPDVLFARFVDILY
jgi:D-alanyl-D-alanine carboxypeptidase